MFEAKTRPFRRSLWEPIWAPATGRCRHNVCAAVTCNSVASIAGQWNRSGQGNSCMLGQVLQWPAAAPEQIVLEDVISENRRQALRPCLRFNQNLNIWVPGVFSTREWREGRIVYLTFLRDRIHIVPSEANTNENEPREV